MKALILEGKNQTVQYKDVPNPKPGQGEVVVQIKAAALNRRDVFITQGLYPGIKFPIILGSDGAGLYNNREVIINPNNDWGPNDAFQSKKYHILGMPKNGTFAEQVVVNEDRLVDKPMHLSWEQAAALPLAGMTAYRALFTKGKLEKGDNLLVTGIGGGVAQFVLQFAVAVGANVYVTSSSDEKIARAKELGAKGSANYRKDDWNEQLSKQAGAFDVIVDSAGGSGFTPLLKLCKPGARVVIYGGTRGKVPEISPQIIFWKQISILGTTMSTDGEFKDMIDFVNKHHIVPIIDSVYDIKDGAEAFQRMANSDQFGKIVIRIDA